MSFFAHNKVTVRVACLCLALVMAGSLAGCQSAAPSGQTTGPASTTSPPSGNVTTTQGTQPDVQRREVVVIRSAMTETLDPVGSSAVAALDAFVQLYEPFMRKDGSGEIFPVLAEDWSISNDGLVYTLKLREGVKFSDGSDFTSADALFSIERTRESNFTKSYFTTISKVEAPDTHTVAITLNEPSAAFLENLCTVFVVNKAAAEEYGAEFGTAKESVVTTAPYLCTEYTPAVSLSFERNPQYWGEPASIEKWSMRLVVDATTAAVALQTGEADIYINDVPASNLSDMRANSGLNVVEFPGTTCFFVALNIEVGEFTNLDLRKAIAYAVDREKALTITLDGNGVVTNTLANNNFTAAPDVDWYEKDVDKAIEHLKAAGKEGLKVTIKAPAINSYLNVTTSVQNDLAAIGINAEVEQQENATFVDNVCNKYQYEIAISSIGTKTTDYSEAASKLLSTNPSNYYRFLNDEYDALTSQGDAELDTAKRREFYTQAAQLANENVAVIPLFYNLGIRAYSSELYCNPDLLSYDCIYYYQWVN